MRDELDDLGRGGAWYSGDRFVQIDAAYNWHIPWHVWLGKKEDELTDDERIEMIVYLRVKGDKEAWEAYVNEPKSTPNSSS